MSLASSIKEYASLSPFNLTGTAKALSNLRFPMGSGGQAWGWGGFLQSFNTRINYAQEVGDLQNVTLIQAVTQWVARGLTSAPLKVVTIGEDDKETIVEHPLTELFRRPNPYYARQVLLRGIALSLTIADEAYVIKVRSRFGAEFGAPLELWWEPHWSIRPRWRTGFIDWFEYERDGIWYPLDPKDVIVFRRDLDPKTRRGYGPTSSMIREFYTDQQASGFMAQLLRHGLVPPIIVGLGTEQNPFNGDKDSFAKALQRKMSGDTAGEPMVVPGGFDVQKLGFDYSSVGLEKVRQIPVERLCAVMGISPISLNLTTSSNKGQAYANVENYLKNDYKSYIIPLHDYIGEELERQLLPEFGVEGVNIRWDYSRVPLMRPDTVSEATVATTLYEKGVIQLNEARERVEYKPVPDGDQFVGEIGMSLGAQLLTKPGEIAPEDLGDDEDEKVKPNGRAVS